MNKYILLLSFILTFFSLNAQPELKFTRYTTSDGLAHNDVLSICQDTLGFIWIGTKDGCSRFDGIEFKNYQSDKDITGSTGLGWVNQVSCDSKNQLWFAITGGKITFMTYDYETDSFTDLSEYIKNPFGANKDFSACWKAYPDSKGNIWLNTEYFGIALYNPGTHKIDSLGNQNDVLGDLNVRDIIEDSDQNMWFATSTGLIFYNRENNLFKQYAHNPNDLKSISSDDCSAVFQDSDSQIWIGTHNGLNKLICLPSGQVVFKRFFHAPYNPFSLSHNHILSINEDNNKNLFIATLNGLSLFDKKNSKFYRYYNDETNIESINSNLVRIVFRDKQDNIWVGTSAGIGKLRRENFKSFSHSSIKNSISHNKVQYVCEAYNKDIWIATPRGIDIFNRKTGKFNFKIEITKNNKGLYGPPIALYSDNEKGMWIGTWNGGISYFNYAGNKITNYIANPDAQFAKDIFSVFKDSKNRLWIGTHREGVYVYDEKTDTYKTFTYDEHNKNSLSSIGIRCIIEDSESNIWIGTLKGLNLLVDFEKGIFKRYLEETGINQIIESSSKDLWIATGIDLYKFNRVSGQFRKVNIPVNNTMGILEDGSKNLWISSNKGLFKLDSLENITIYRKEEGVNIVNFIERSNAKLSDGSMIFGGSEGFCMFKPSTVKTDSVPPTVIFTNLKIANKTIRAGQKINGQIILEKSITATQKLVFNYQNSAFTIEFTGLQYNLPQYTQYCYKLEGYDRPDGEWHYVDVNNRKADYMNLPSGHYIFKVKAANSYGLWNNKEAKLEITVLPPWWETKWFTALWIFACIATVFLFIRLRTRNLQKQKQKLKMLVEQRTQELKEMNFILSEKSEELEQQMEQLAEMNEKVTETNKELWDANAKLEIKTTEVENIAKQLHEADQSKLRFFANVSHEFRTPLSLIIGPLEKCLNLEKPVDWDSIKNNYLQLMHRNSKRLLRLINQVIDFRKIEQGGKKLNISNNNIVEFTKDVIDIFAALARQKNINLNLESQYPTINFQFDPDIMEKILYNLISNAIKYTPEEGEISVQLSVNSEQSTENSDQLTVRSNQSYDSPLNADNCLLITVKDTGIGIKKENLDKIFDRFYREETNENYTIEGTGIGLAYTKELVELHKGSISVESEPKKGTSFILRFPIVKENSNMETIDDSSTPAGLNYIRSMIGTSEYADKVQSTETEKTKKETKDGLSDKKQTILIVEDNSDLREFIINELNTDYLVYEAKNGKEGLELALQNEPELIISDIMMPVMDGIELCKRIKSSEDTSHIPVILLTAKGSDEDQIKGLETGANDYIPKPFNINVLKIKIENLFLLRERMREKFSKSINVAPSEITFSRLDQQFIQKAIEVVNKNIQDYEFDNDAFVDQMNFSRTQVYRKIKSITNQSVSEFIRSIRLKAAARLFLEGNFNIAEVSYNVGFKYPADLTRYFSKMFGMSPRQFIKNQNR